MREIRLTPHLSGSQGGCHPPPKKLAVKSAHHYHVSILSKEIKRIPWENNRHRKHSFKKRQGFRDFRCPKSSNTQSTGPFLWSLLAMFKQTVHRWAEPFKAFTSKDGRFTPCWLCCRQTSLMRTLTPPQSQTPPLRKSDPPHLPHY